jgi:ketosteroid isomerase-like protein
MASENLDLVRSIYATRKRDELDWWAHPDIEVVSVDGPQPGTWRGVGGLADALRTWRDASEDFRAEPVEFRALGDNRVLILIRRSGRGRTSGLELQELRTDGAAVFHIRDGKVARVVNYFDRDPAFADLGIEE